MKSSTAQYFQRIGYLCILLYLFYSPRGLVFAQQSGPSLAPVNDSPTTGSTETSPSSTSPSTSSSTDILTIDAANGNVPPGGGSPGDIFNFQADLFTGRFSYSVPIVVAPGRQGAQPALNLGYNSSGGNGWCGLGWTLDVGYIQRDTRKGVPIQWSPGSPTPLKQYDDSKGFIANFGGINSTLVLVSPTNQNPVVYRQEADTGFLKYNYYNDNHWEVVDKSGNTFYFGQGSTNQMENPKSGWTVNAGQSTFRWALNMVTDVNGNQTTLSYSTDGGMLYLTNISYNANINLPSIAATHTVDFILTNRSDTNITFMSGFRVQTQKLLSEIRIKVSGSNVRKYVLSYISSPSTMRSLLASVTEYGSDFTSSLPPVTFSYQVKPFQFAAATDWMGLNSQIVGVDAGWNGIRSFQSGNLGFLTMVDIDGDGLPDRVMETNTWYTGAPPFNFYVQRNTGSNFVYTNYAWPIHPYADNFGVPVERQNSGTATVYDMVDINGDGLPDTVVSTGTNFIVTLNTGFLSTGFTTTNYWAPVTNSETTSSGWYLIRNRQLVDFMDMNGDGLPDRLNSKVFAPYDRFKVQLNTGNGFTAPVDWAPLNSQGDTTSGWNALWDTGSAGDEFVMMADINGDGLPDRIMRVYNPPYTNFVVQFNNGAGFEPDENWGPLDSQGQTSSNWNSPIGTDGLTVWAGLVDINGDGLLDRVMRTVNSPWTNYVVQLNTGSGFGPAVNWGPLDSQGRNTYDFGCLSANDSNPYTYLDLIDINGDGLPDRVMRRMVTPYDRFVVQLNKGPFPDLMNVVSNGFGGSIEVSYVPSTTLDNRNTNWVSDPWTEGTRSLLPFPVYVVSQIAVLDGLGDTNLTSYSFKGGYYNPAKREFRGFSQATVTDALGTKTITYFCANDQIVRVN